MTTDKQKKHTETYNFAALLMGCGGYVGRKVTLTQILDRIEPIKTNILKAKKELKKGLKKG